MTVKGQSRARNVPLGPELEKVGREVESYRRFVQLCQQLVEISEQICDLRPVQEIKEEEALDPKKKLRGSTRRSRGGAWRLDLGEWQRQGQPDLEAGELAVRANAPSRGRLLEQLLGADRGGQEARIDCGQGHEAQFKGYRHKQLSTVLGAVRCTGLLNCADCGGGVVPKDGDLDLASTSFSPGVRRMMGRVGAKEPFLAGVAVSTKAVERVSEIGDDVQSVSEREREQAFSEKIVPFASPPAPTMYVASITGVPVRPAEVEGRVGKGGGAAKTREAKLGCVFAQTRCDEQGRALRDPDSTTYVGAIEEAAAFGARIYTEAARRGATRAPNPGGSGRRCSLDLHRRGTLPPGHPCRFVPRPPAPVRVGQSRLGRRLSRDPAVGPT